MRFQFYGALMTGLLAVFVLLGGAGGARGRERFVDIDTIAADVAWAIQEAPEVAGEISKVRMFDFEERHREPTELAHELTRQLAESLQKRANGFVLLGSEEFRKAIPQADLPAGLFSSAVGMRCYAPELGATMLVEGELEVVPDGALVTVKVWSAKARRYIFGESGIVPLTPEMEKLATQHRPPVETPDLSTPGGRVWVSREHPPVRDEDAIRLDGSEKGYTSPKCVRCPSPQFSDDATQAKQEGTVVMRVQVLADGSIAKISLVRGLPCGLTEQAFEAVEGWQLEPAIGPDGKPVAVNTGIEVTFRFY
jgi:TonB family protein